MDRYAGKPFLRLLDSYFLDVIGQLSEEQDEALAAMQPRLAQVYGDEGTLQDMVAAQMQSRRAWTTRCAGSGQATWSTARPTACLQTPTSLWSRSSTRTFRGSNRPALREP